MLYLEDIKISFKCQGYEAIQYGMSPSNDQAVLMLRSTRGSRDETCPRCGEKVYIYDSFGIHLRDMPLYIDIPLTVFCTGNRYRCTVCGETFTEEIPFKYPGTRITYRAAKWIKGFLQQKVSIKAIQKLTGIVSLPSSSKAMCAFSAGVCASAPIAGTASSTASIKLMKMARHFFIKIKLPLYDFS